MGPIQLINMILMCVECKIVPVENSFVYKIKVHASKGSQIPGNALLPVPQMNSSNNTNGAG